MVQLHRHQLLLRQHLAAQLRPGGRGRGATALSRLLLVNGAPGSGKSTVAEALARGRAMMLPLDVDGLKHALGRWDEDPSAAGLHARRLVLALAAEHVRSGHDVVISQYLARTDFIEELDGMAGRFGAQFVEVVLEVSAGELALRLAARSASPSRPEHAVNNRLVGPADAERLVASLDGLRDARPRAVWVDAGGSMESTLQRVLAAIA